MKIVLSNFTNRPQSDDISRLCSLNGLVSTWMDRKLARISRANMALICISLISTRNQNNTRLCTIFSIYLLNRIKHLLPGRKILLSINPT